MFYKHYCFIGNFGPDYLQSGQSGLRDRNTLINTITISIIDNIYSSLQPTEISNNPEIDEKNDNLFLKNINSSIYDNNYLETLKEDENINLIIENYDIKPKNNINAFKYLTAIRKTIDNTKTYKAYKFLQTYYDWGCDKLSSNHYRQIKPVFILCKTITDILLELLINFPKQVYTKDYNKQKKISNKK